MASLLPLRVSAIPAHTPPNSIMKRTRSDGFMTQDPYSPPNLYNVYFTSTPHSFLFSFKNHLYPPLHFAADTVLIQVRACHTHAHIHTFTKISLINFLMHIPITNVLDPYAAAASLPPSLTVHLTSVPRSLPHSYQQSTTPFPNSLRHAQGHPDDIILVITCVLFSYSKVLLAS